MVDKFEAIPKIFTMMLIMNIREESSRNADIASTQIKAEFDGRL